MGKREAKDLRLLCECVELHLSLRAPSARVDLPLDKGRLLGASAATAVPERCVAIGTISRDFSTAARRGSIERLDANATGAVNSERCVLWRTILMFFKTSCHLDGEALLKPYRTFKVTVASNLAPLVGGEIP